MNKNIEQNVNGNRHGTDKINSISGNLIKIKVSVDLFYVSDAPSWKFRVRLCTYISEKNLGRLLEQMR